MTFQNPRGTRDFPPQEMIKRMWVAEVIKKTFVKWGFDPLGTPALETWELLAKKGGGGEAIKDEIYYFKDKSDRELGLRFDWTVPMSRFVANNPQLPKPFRRFQIGPVWRYDRPQAGRYREFWQADIDIIGTMSPISDAEIIACTCDVFKTLGFKEFKIRLSSRTVIESLVKSTGVPQERIVDVFRSIDKLDKISEKGVREELEKKGFTKDKISAIMDFIIVKGRPYDVLKTLGDVGGADNLRQVVQALDYFGYRDFVEIDLSLVRGLEYYTGPVYEVFAGKGYSLAGGGRYDKLIETLGGKPTPATGISLGFDRICDVMNEQKMFSVGSTNTKVFVVTFQGLEPQAAQILGELRAKGIPAQMDVMGRPLKKQLDYINSLGIPYALFAGEREISEKKYTFRDMKTGKEEKVSLEGIAKSLS